MTSRSPQKLARSSARDCAGSMTVWTCRHLRANPKRRQENFPSVTEKRLPPPHANPFSDLLSARVAQTYGVSIYATLWTLKFPKEGDWLPDCDWIEVTAQGVPAHIGSPSPGAGYEKG